MNPSHGPNPELRPGDAGFTGFQMQLPENCIEYMLFILDTQPDRAFSQLEEVRRAALRLIDELTKDYIWQREAFNLELKRDKGLTYLSGLTDYGDSVEDEWLIVYLLRELTKKFTNLWVRVTDNDGEFLLVEAANVLPKWLSPENDSHRVWIQDGKLHLIPLTGNKKELSLPEAVEYLSSSRDKLVHSTFVEAEAFYRLEKYPRQIADSLHHSTVTIPRKLASLLHTLPKSIAPATEEFYLRDELSLKPVFSPQGKLAFPPEDLVTVSIVFTKVLYAQLKSQHFDPPPPAWKSIIHFAQVAAVNNSPSTVKALNQLEMGMKLTTGFEILARKAEKSNNRLVRELALVLADMEEDGPSALPSDTDIKGWKDVEREDDDSWMDIDWQTFEQELDGKNAGPKSKHGKEKEGFGSKTTEADLKKIVSKFEAFLNDESAGIDGAELDEMDEDDDDDEDDDYNEFDEDEDSEDEDKAVSFDEEQFSKLMREMMGFPPEETPSDKGKAPDKEPKRPRPQVEKKDEVDEEKDEVMKLMAAFEAELKGHGALDIDPKPQKPRAIKDKGKGKEKNEGPSKRVTFDEEYEESGEEEVDIDYNLAKNLLESFKGQAGLAGPAGNMLKMMGIQLPRDEGDEDDDED